MAQSSAGDQRITDELRRAYEALRDGLGPGHSLTRTAAAMIQEPNSAAKRSSARFGASPPLTASTCQVDRAP